METISTIENTITAFDRTFTLKRLIGKIETNNNAPTIIAVAGIHGNERAGIVALETVFEKLTANNVSFNGNFYGFQGNLKAIKENVRFFDFDLNRIWREENFIPTNSEINNSSEYEELMDLYSEIKKIVTTKKGPFIFLDLHTTSATTKPFITISDSLKNRTFCKNFPVPVILGIEEYLEGPFLSYINKFGHIALGFEGGQHKDVNSVKYCESFVYAALTAAKCVKKKNVLEINNFETILNEVKDIKDFREITYRYVIKKTEDFKMLPGYTNFDEVYTNQLLAYSNGTSVKSPFSGEIFLPLYQDKGDDGFFIVQRIHKFWLTLSRIIRRLNLHVLLRLLPGIKKNKQFRNTLEVNPKVASLLTTEVFHLFGYRKKLLKEDKWLFSKRDKKVIDFY